MPAYRAKPKIFDALNDKEQYNTERYSTSKLLDTLWTLQLGEHLKASTHPEDKKISLSGYPPPKKEKVGFNRKGQSGVVWDFAFKGGTVLEFLVDDQVGGSDSGEWI
jgi:hypothetical protein